MHFKDFFQSVAFRWVVVGISVLIGAMLIFQAVVFGGYHKAEFSYRWGDNYFRGFGRPHGGMMMRGFTEGNGVAGTIVKIALPELVVDGVDHVEKTVTIVPDTAIRHFREEAASSTLKVGDFIVALGSPDAQSRIEARFIRIMPAPAQKK